MRGRGKRRRGTPRIPVAASGKAHFHHLFGMADKDSAPLVRNFESEVGTCRGASLPSLPSGSKVRFLTSQELFDVAELQIRTDFCFSHLDFSIVSSVFLNPRH